MDLVLEMREQDDRTPVLAVGGAAVMITPAVGEDYWLYRVRLSGKQAVVGFPKFATIGIGFAREGSDWNTNLPYNCPTDDILRHILHNKGERSIADADVRRAILMIQMAVIERRVAARRTLMRELNAAADLVPLSVTVDGRPVRQLVVEAMQALNTAIREADMLTAEVHRAARPQAEPVVDPSSGIALAEPYEWCTTWARRKRHVSAKLKARKSRGGKGEPGRAGGTLCGGSGMDAAAVDHDLSVWSTRSAPFNLDRLPVCGLCAKSLRKVT